MPFSPEGLISPSHILFSGSASLVLHLSHTFNQVRHQQAGTALKVRTPSLKPRLLRIKRKPSRGHCGVRNHTPKHRPGRNRTVPIPAAKQFNSTLEQERRGRRDRWGRDVRYATAPPPYLPSCSHSLLSIIERPLHRANRIGF